MAYEIPGFVIGTEVTAADLSAGQFRAVKFTATGWDFAGAGEQAVGILQDKPASGKVAEVVADGISKVVAGAAFAKGAKLMTNATGKLITATATNHIVAQALAAAGAADELVSAVIGYKGVAA
jgi:hypothetical protein